MQCVGFNITREVPNDLYFTEEQMRVKEVKTLVQGL